MKAYLNDICGPRISEVPEPVPEDDQVLVRSVPVPSIVPTSVSRRGMRMGRWAARARSWKWNGLAKSSRAAPTSRRSRLATGSWDRAAAPLRICARGPGPTAADSCRPGFRAGRGAAHRPDHDARCSGHQRPVAAGSIGACAGRQLGCRADGPSNRQTPGCQARDRIVVRPQAPWTAQGGRRRPRGGFECVRMGRPGSACDGRPGRRPCRRPDLRKGRQSKPACRQGEGRVVNVGRLGGTQGEFDFDLHAARQIRYVGVTFRTRSVQEIRDIFQRVRNDLWPALESGALTLPVDRVFAFDAIGDAFAHVEANRRFGKVVVRL
ncbi:MAG: hypothetical protein GAK38_01185 [Xylophilus sp.]|nr:MAG: hypothetical protein GAK38_01185 [Xylophilus sp.]